MKSNLSLRQIRHLEARVDEIALKAYTYEIDPEEVNQKRKNILKGGATVAATGAAAYGAKKGYDAFKSRYGYPDYDGSQMVNRQSFKKAGGDVVDAGASALDKLKKSKGVTAGTKAWNRSAGQGFLKRAGRVISSGARAMFHEAGPLDVTEFAALLEFEHPSQASAKRKNQDPGGNWGRGVGMGLVGSLGHIAPAVAGAKNANQYRDARVVYRKRDAAKDGAVGLLGGVAGAVGTQAAINTAVMSHARRHGRGEIDALMRHGGKAHLAGTAASLAGGYAASRALAKRRLRKIQKQADK